MFKTPLTAGERLVRVRANIQRFGYLPLLQDQTADVGTVTICGFGPSLVNTWREIKGTVCTTSGSHDFLIAKGIIPTYHVECDPREHKTNFIRNSHPAVMYLLNSQCHPSMFEALLPDRNVVMWHGFTDDDVDNQLALIGNLGPWSSRPIRVLAGGTNVGMRAISVMREWGHTGFELHGFDCCYHKEKQWAGEHFTQRHKTVEILVEGKVFETSDLMMQSTDDFFFKVLGQLPGCRFRVHGDGLLETRLRLYNRDPQKALNWGWWQPVNFTVRTPENQFGVGWKEQIAAWSRRLIEKEQGSVEKV